MLRGSRLRLYPSPQMNWFEVTGIVEDTEFKTLPASNALCFFHLSVFSLVHFSLSY